MPYLVMGAGDAEFDGFYEVDTTRIGGKRDRSDTAACYRKVGSSCTMNYNRTDHAWFMCKDHRGAWYKNTTESEVPPASGWARANQGKAPPPTIRFAGCVGLLSVQPLALRVKHTASVDGLYVIDAEQGEKDGVACYRRVNSSETLHRNNGTWYISTRYDHRSSWFEVSQSQPRAQTLLRACCEAGSLGGGPRRAPLLGLRGSSATPVRPARSARAAAGASLYRVSCCLPSRLPHPPACLTLPPASRARPTSRVAGVLVGAAPSRRGLADGRQGRRAPPRREWTRRPCRRLDGARPHGRTRARR